MSEQEAVKDTLRSYYEAVRDQGSGIALRHQPWPFLRHEFSSNAKKATLV